MAHTLDSLRGCSIVIYARTSSYNDWLYICIHEKDNYERRLSNMVNRCCRLLVEGTIAEEDITPHIHSYCLYFSFEEAWFMLILQFIMTDLDYQTRARLTHLDFVAHDVIGWQNVRFLLPVPPIDQFPLSVQTSLSVPPTELIDAFASPHLQCFPITVTSFSVSTALSVISIEW